jgi:hypothetical protein
MLDYDAWIYAIAGSVGWKSDKVNCSGFSDGSNIDDKDNFSLVVLADMLEVVVQAMIFLTTGSYF